MKKIYFFTALLLSFSAAIAQKNDEAIAMDLVSKNAAEIGLSPAELRNNIVSNTYINTGTDIRLVYLQQSYQGLPVFNQIHVLAFRDGKLVSNAGGRIKDIEGRVNSPFPVPSIGAEEAVRTAMASKKISFEGPLSSTLNPATRKLDFGKPSVVTENITAELMWVPVNEGKEVKLAWQVYLVPLKSSDYLLIRIDAINNKVIEETNLTVYCNWEKKSGAPKSRKPRPRPDNISGAAGSPSVVNGASYRVIPFPAESPIHPGGTPAIRTDPWNAAPGNATTLKWHTDNTDDYDITRGNNVFVQEDHDKNNNTFGDPATSTTSLPGPLSFDFVPNFSVEPTQTTPVQNQQFNLTNVFYWNNIIHDVMYQYGFDEPGGNFQSDNLGRGGVGNDYVIVDAQDASDTSNANFATPADGGRGRMQMYLWYGEAAMYVNSPALIDGPYVIAEGNVSNNNKLLFVPAVTGQLVYYNDVATGTHEACVNPSNSLTGKIALIRRGTCNYNVKIKNAQNAGAIGVVMVNNVPGAPVIMTGTDNTITIPAVMVSDIDGTILASQLANNVSVTLNSVYYDGDVDNGVVVHEFGHGISNRLTGGPSQPSCVSNAEHMGEGWSDYYCLMFTQNWATATLTTGFNEQRTIGTYTLGEDITGSGVRNLPYSTDFTVNDLVYSSNLPSETHDRGEIWCATLWDMTWNIINQVGSINPNIYDATGGGGNTIAMRLVTHAMKLQPCNPGFINGRDAIIQADLLLYGGTYGCAIREAFRRRGMGQNASQGLNTSISDQTPDYTAWAVCNCTAVNITAQPVNVTACVGGNATFTVTVSGTSPTFQWQVSTDGGVNFSDVAGATTASLTLTSVTLAMNNNRYKVIVTNSCSGNVTSTEAILTVTNPANITAQPVNATVCAGENASFTVTATGTSITYQWQVSTDGGINYTNIPGATSATLNLTTVTADMNNYRYRVVISSCAPALNSNAAILTVNSQAVITAQPANFNACTGSTATFSVTVTGTTPTYQWQVSTDGGLNYTNIPGATTSTLSLPSVTSGMNNNLYQVVINNACTSNLTSAAALLNVSEPAAITTQPSPVTVCAGNNASFSVTATGTNITYQWQVSVDGGANYTNITGAASATLNLASVTAAMNNNRYRVVISSCGPTLTSNAVILTVNNPAVITVQPANTNACTGGSATISVTVTGTTPTYQWQVSTDGGANYTNIPGATSATLSLPTVTSGMNNNLYQVVINNVCTTNLTSAAALLSVSDPAIITVQPSPVTVCDGSNAAFSVTATGTNITYQWQVSVDGGANYTNISGATAATLNLTAVTAAMNNNRYRVVVFSCSPTGLNSTEVLLTVNTAVSITTQPANVAVCTGTDATFSVTAAGTSVSYQWQVSTDGGVNYSDIPGANGASLTLTAVTVGMNDNRYRVIITNSCTPAGATSNSATLTVSNAASITTQPSDITACAGTDASFTVTATGFGFQWQESTDGGVNYTNISGATTASLTLTAVTAAMNNNRYRVVINSCGTSTITSNAATLSVVSPVTVVTQPANVAVCDLNDALFSINLSGIPVSLQWQQSTDGGLNYSDLPGATNTTLSLSSVDLSMTNYRYRVIITNTAPCPPTISDVAILTVNAIPVVGANASPATVVCQGDMITLTGTGATSYTWNNGVSNNVAFAATSSNTYTVTGTQNGCSNTATIDITVNPLPDISISASPYTRLLAGLTTTLTATSPVTTFAWYKDNVLLPATGSTINVDYSGLGVYRAEVTDLNGCTNSAEITIADSILNFSFIFPNPNRGEFFIRYSISSNNSVQRIVSMWDAKGARVFSKRFTVTSPVIDIPISVGHLSSGVYFVELSDMSGNRLETGKVIIL
jgi:extracellular elastinolytic metalloproteinase